MYRRTTASVFLRTLSAAFAAENIAAVDAKSTSNLNVCVLLNGSDGQLWNQMCSDRTSILRQQRQYFQLKVLHWAFGERTRPIWGLIQGISPLLCFKQGRLCSCNFITRMLFKACYWLCSTSFYSRYFPLIYMHYCVIVAFCQHVLNEHAMLCYADHFFCPQKNEHYRYASFSFYSRVQSMGRAYKTSI